MRVKKAPITPEMPCQSSKNCYMTYFLAALFLILKPLSTL